MPSLRDLRRRIRSVQNMRKITKAMELVAAARMRRAQERVVNARPYSEEIASIMAELMKRSPQYKHPYLQVREVKARVLILVTADRGLCGALNSNNIRLALREMNASAAPVAVVTIGRKGRDVIHRLRRNLIADRSELGDKPTIGDILPAGENGRVFGRVTFHHVVPRDFHGDDLAENIVPLCFGCHELDTGHLAKPCK